MELGRRAEALDDFRRALKGDPEESLALRWQARLHLEAGDQAGYRRACAALLKAHTETQDPILAQDLVETCTIGAGAPPDLSLLLRLAWTALAGRKGDYPAQAAVGAALLRAGRHREAVERLQKALKLRKEGAPREELLLAIACHHLGQAADARRWLEKATAWLDHEQLPPRVCLLAGSGAAGSLQLLPALGSEEFDPLRPRLGWAACLDLHLLRREAGILLGPGR
jgi:tetratricopeptide (TPR) repeat protein